MASSKEASPLGGGGGGGGGGRIYDIQPVRYSNFDIWREIQSCNTVA